VAQVAVCALLLISSAIVLRSEQRMKGGDTGLDTAGVYDIRTLARYQRPAAARLRQEPGVEAVAICWRAPLYGSLRRMSVTPAGRKDPAISGYNHVSAGYFDVFRIPVLRGRTFTEQEGDAEAPLVLVSEGTARRFWPGQDALGQTFAIPPAPVDDYHRYPGYSSARVIGVVKEVSSGGTDNTAIYFPTGQRSRLNLSVLARLTGSPVDGRRRIEKSLEQIAPSLSDMINPMKDIEALNVYPFRVASWIAGFLAGVALILTVTGIYGVMSYVVSQRAKEIGIRMALGASAPSVLWMVFRQSGKLAAIGALLGGGTALMLSPLFRGVLGSVIQPYEPLPYVVTMTIVFLAAVGASYAPSRRALRIDPMETLRCD
jgi:hypothetical protein